MKMRKFTWLVLLLLSSAIGQLNAQWEEQESGYESPWILFDNSFPPGQNNVGFIGGMYTTYDGDGIILKTVDGGENWELNLGGPDGSLEGIEAIFFTSLDIGYAAGWNDDILYTDDGGDNWTAMSVGTNVWYYTDIEFWDEDNGLISAQLNSGSSQVWVTDDGGDTWTAATGISIGIIDVAYADADNVFAVGSEEDIIKSTDGGLTWSVNNNGGGSDPLVGVNFYNSNFGVVGGMNGLVKVTTNGGSSWSSTNISGSYPSFYATYCFNTDSIYVGGTDNIIFKSTDGGNSWVSDNSGGSGTLYQFAVTSNKTAYVTGSSGVILTKASEMNVDFWADNTEICAGGTVNFTDNSSQATTWEWTFEGGTPSTSTEQNPSVVYENSGTYNVELTISNGETEMTELKNDYISVLETPDQADRPDGEDNACTDNFYVYTTDAVDYATDYEWELMPEEAGNLTWTMNEAELETDSDWTGDFTIRVRALNECGTGEWSDDFEGSVSASPLDYMVEGGGTYCQGGEGVEISLSGSDTGVEYELYLDGDPTGISVEGTGDAISFGLQTDEGYYTVLASNDNCEQNMSGQVEVVVDFPPLEPGIPEGPQVICNEESTDYTTSGTGDADSYEWMLSPEEAGTLVADGMEASVNWNAEFNGMAYLSVLGVNDCGEGNPSTDLEISVDGVPTPEIDGEALACDFSTETYAVEEHDGSTYTWEVTGGTLSEGQGTYMITVEWGGVGTGTIMVMEETEGGCSGSSETFDVTLDDCTATSEILLQENVTLYPNPASGKINLEMVVSNGRSGWARVYNTVGQLVREQEFKGTGDRQVFTFDLNGLSSGLFTIQLVSAGEMLWHGKFMKKD